MTRVTIKTEQNCFKDKNLVDFSFPNIIFIKM